MRGTLLGARPLTGRALRARALRPTRPLRARRIGLARALRSALGTLRSPRAGHLSARAGHLPARPRRTGTLWAAGALRAGRR
ncbi:hypothetical protein, partial [Tsukamurella columbiensis]|uniref:hypothetical protein n=1 Tax=Tsukamurella columbiensis TaxID=128509 RepID=UPI001CA83155